MRSLYEDLRYAIRVLRGSPGFTAVAVLTLALGIAANATVFGWIDTLLVRPFPGVAGGDGWRRSRPCRRAANIPILPTGITAIIAIA